MSNYNELLDRAEDKVTRGKKEQRFEVPEPELHRQGPVTIISNFSEIADDLGREEKHLLKFLAGELAAPGELDGSRAKFQGKFRKRQVREKLDDYVDEYVLCECGRPDTELKEEDSVTRLKCHACGAKDVVKPL